MSQLPSNARGNTIAHLRRMLATAGAVSAASCSRAQDVVTVTIPAQPMSTDSSPNQSPPPPAPTPTQTVAQPVPSPPPDPSGYLVVDMLPAPAHCLGLANITKASAKFRRDGSDLVIDVTVTLPSGSTFSGTSPGVWGGTLKSSSYRGSSAVNARVRPNTGMTSAGASFSVVCGSINGSSGGVGTLGVTASFSATPKDGDAVQISLQDY